LVVFVTSLLRLPLAAGLHLADVGLPGIRKELAGSAELCRDICDTFERAKWAVAELCNTQALSVILPWADIFVQDVRAVMVEDYWPFGLAASRWKPFSDG
jgi:hypothetical protein